jgi:hypothetical protein
MDGTPYYEDAKFKDYYFEDSFVLAMRRTEEAFVFDLDVVLCGTHPEYKGIRPGEYHAHALAELKFRDYAILEEEDMLSEPHITDALGQRDFGAIDAFTRIAPDTYRLEGEWGKLVIRARSVEIKLLPRTD